MGSMTGAPKHRVLDFTEQYEAQQRGLFSGTIGYCSPSGDFDLNVVIRSMFLNPENGTVDFLAGGGITKNSVPEHEYEESILKTRAIRKILGIPV
ncbi:MAG: chorismate-binding protein [Ferruginibacter sp.]|nr:chorismate-binding protein [Ferruginibacter sp.]